MMAEQIFLTLNAGSSSIKFALYRFTPATQPAEFARGQVDSVGGEAKLEITVEATQKRIAQLGHADHQGALRAILEEANRVLDGQAVSGVGHRVAHGGPDFAAPTRLDDATVAALRKLEPLAPLHQPHNLAAVDAARTVFPAAIQVACFDTAFHRNHPWVNDTFAIPRRFYEAGVRRYGFHGLSYDYVTGALAGIDEIAAQGRVIIAHLGNGASMCAVENGRSIASTMGFSALDGLPMGTRCGQLDPGVLLYLMDHEGLDSSQIATLLYKESGLKGLSGLTHDMRSLEASDALEAKQAIDYFVFRIRREIGAMAAVLNGLDALVFCGGIGENSSMVRERVCRNMEWLGLELDANANTARSADARDISKGDLVPIYVIPTNEELVIARALAHFATQSESG